MKLKEIFDQLGTGELSQVKFGETGTILAEDYPKIVNHVNMGLSALFTRFLLKDGEVVIGLKEGRTLYPLHSDYSVMSSKKPLADRFIEDSIGGRFQDDLLKIERVLSDSEAEFALNVSGNPWSLSTSNLNTLKVPAAVLNKSDTLPEKLVTDSLVVMYRAQHPKIVVNPGYWEPSRVEVEVPYSHLQALLYFVASRVHNPIGMGQEFNAGNNWLMRYEQECQRLENEGLEIDQNYTHDAIYRNGWV